MRVRSFLGKENSQLLSSPLLVIKAFPHERLASLSDMHTTTLDKVIEMLSVIQGEMHVLKKKLISLRGEVSTLRRENKDLKALILNKNLNTTIYTTRD